MALYFSDTDFQLRLLQDWQQSLPGGRSSADDAAAEPFTVCPVALRHRGHQSTQQLGDRRVQWQRDFEFYRARWL